MTNEDRANELKRLRKQVQDGDLRSDIRERRNILAAITPLLNFNNVYYANALQTADILSRPGFSSNAYEQSEGRLDVLMGQAITELEHSLTPSDDAAPPDAATQKQKGPQKARPDIPEALTKDHGVYWLFTHSHWRVRISMVLLALFLVGLGFTAAQNKTINQFWTDWITPILNSAKSIIR